MQSRLVAFQFEDDQLVTLQFSDGAYLTLAVGDAKSYLLPKDRTKLQRAQQLRNHFINTTLPPWASLVLLASIATLLLTSRIQFAGWQMLAPELPLVTPMIGLPVQPQSPSASKAVMPSADNPIKQAEAAINHAKSVITKSTYSQPAKQAKNHQADDKIKIDGKELKHEKD